MFLITSLRQCAVLHRVAVHTAVRAGVICANVTRQKTTAFRSVALQLCPDFTPEMFAAQVEATAHGPMPRVEARTQRKDGTWGRSVHAGDARKLEPSMENGLSLLYETLKEALGRNKIKILEDLKSFLKSILTIYI